MKLEIGGVISSFSWFSVTSKEVTQFTFFFSSFHIHFLHLLCLISILRVSNFYLFSLLCSLLWCLFRIIIMCTSSSKHFLDASSPLITAPKWTSHSSFLLSVAGSSFASLPFSSPSSSSDIFMRTYYLYCLSYAFSWSSLEIISASSSLKASIWSKTNLTNTSSK